MEINYEGMSEKVRKTVRIMESKPHIKYIRYLLTKRFSPIQIKRELQRLGLSAPHEEPMIVYYLAVIDPIVKKNGLSSTYSSYKGKLLNKKNPRGAYAMDILKYKLEFADNIDGQIKFCKFLNELEIEEVWISELIKMYGRAENIPVDENGERIIKGGLYKRSITKLLTHPKRYLIDKMILEKVPTKRIVEYINKNFEGMKLFDYDIKYYKAIFFNMKSYDIEDKIKLITAERNNLQLSLDAIESDEEMTLGDKTSLIQKTQARIEELDDNVKLLNSLYSETTMKSIEFERDNLEEMFLDIVTSSYSRFKHLDQFKDRDVVDPLMKTVKIMGYAYDKANEAKHVNNGNISVAGDVHSQAEMMNLYRKRADELYQEEKEKLELQEANAYGEENLSSGGIDDIMGVEELNILVDMEDDDKEKK